MCIRGFVYTRFEKRDIYTASAPIWDINLASAVVVSSQIRLGGTSEPVFLKIVKL